MQLNFDVSAERHAGASDEIVETVLRLAGGFPVVEVAFGGGCEWIKTSPRSLQTQIRRDGKACIDPFHRRELGGEIAVGLDGKGGVQGLGNQWQFGFDAEDQVTFREAARVAGLRFKLQAQRFKVRVPIGQVLRRDVRRQLRRIKIPTAKKFHSLELHWESRGEGEGDHTICARLPVAAVEIRQAVALERKRITV